MPFPKVGTRHGVRKNRIAYVVDDDEAVRDSTQLLLETCSIPTRGYASAMDFLADFGFGKSGCLIVDVDMPGMGGLELLELLRSCGNSMPVIVFSGHGVRACGESVIRAGAMAMLDKPVDDVEFIKLVEQALFVV